MPPLAALLKSTEVEDPVNVWLHRPLAYAFAWLVYPTSLTPNGVTFVALVVGIGAGGFFLGGSPSDMVAGGVLLWASAILDGADGILARARGTSSQLGRAIDGAADQIVGVCTVFPAFWHIWLRHEEPLHLVLMVPVIGLTALHLAAYDYFKEQYLRHTRLDRGGESDELEQVCGPRLREARHESTVAYLAVKHVLVPALRLQRWLVPLLVPEPPPALPRTASAAELWRENHRLPMRLWAAISSAPHAYLMATCAMLDRLDAYLWIRLVGMNVLFVAAIVLERRAARRTRQGAVELGLVSAVRA